MTHDVEEQVGEDQRACLAMEEHDLVEGRKCSHDRLSHFIGPGGRRIIAEDCGELQVGALGASPGAQNVCASG